MWFDDVDFTDCDLEDLKVIMSMFPAESVVWVESFRLYMSQLRLV